ncbi:MAG: copper homeostasis protein CutC [Muribaculaceae bacterium]
MKPKHYVLEVCAGDIDSAVNACAGGAERIELCSALSEGGITPSCGLVAESLMLGMRVHVLIRPRGGDFLYNDDEVKTMVCDIKALRQLGADGVVIGALTAEGDIDLEACRRMIDAAQGMSVTFHRAFDRCRCAEEALEQIIALGCNRLLTSGQAATAFEGTEMIKRLVNQAAGRLVVMPGCGVNAHNAAEILRQTGATEIHASASVNVPSKMTFARGDVYMGAKDAVEDMRKITDVKSVKDILAAINAIEPC